MAMLALGCLSLAACGDNDGGSGGADAGNGGYYDDPSDFVGAACEAGAFAGLDPLGVWHVEIRLPDFAPFPGAARLDGGGQGLLFGEPADSVETTADHVLVRRTFTSREGYARVRSLLLCGKDAEGLYTGAYASCTGDSCLYGPVIAGPVAPLVEPVAAGLEVVSEFAGEAADPWLLDGNITANVRHHGTMAYVVRFGDGLRIVDLADPANPSARGHSPVKYPDDEIYNDIKMYASGAKLYALAASDLRGVVVIDVSDADAPFEVTTFGNEPPGSTDPLGVHTLYVEGDRAYLANTTTVGLDIFDLSNPAAPVSIGTWVHPELSSRGGYLHDLYVDNGRVYLNYWNLGMVIVDTASTPATPAYVGVFENYGGHTSHSSWVTTAGGRKIALHGDEEFGAKLRIVDVDDQGVAFLDEIGGFATRPQVSIHNVMAVGEVALVTYYQDGLRVLSLADPTKPTEIGHLSTWTGVGASYGTNFFEGAIGVDFDNDRGLVLLADTHRGLFVLTLDP